MMTPLLSLMLAAATPQALPAMPQDLSEVPVIEGWQGRKVSPTVQMIVVPGSVKVRLQAQDEGLDKVFTEAGADWRFAGCSMCLAMNPDKVGPGKRAASTSNRNFEGRQGPGSRTHLVSPQVAAATAVVGRLASPADLEG